MDVRDKSKKFPKGRWPEAEPMIMQDIIYAYSYALNVIKGRWLEAEPYIMRDPQLAFYYARDVNANGFAPKD